MSADPSSASGSTRFVVQIEPDRPAGEVADALGRAGLAIEQVLPSVGIVGGSGPRSLRQALEAVPGVTRVREEGGFDLPPFSDKVPQ